MADYELRSEILAKGRKYYIQTNLVSSQHRIVTSLFHEGDLLSKQVEDYDPSKTAEDVQELVRRCHEERKRRITSLLEIREKLARMEDARGHLRLGEALYHQSLYRESMSEIVRAIKLGLEASGAFSLLGNCLIALDDCEKAVKAFRRGIQISPTHPDIHNGLGRAYLKLKRCRDAVDAFEKAVELNKYYVEAFMNLAMALCLNVLEKEDFELSRDLPGRLMRILKMVLQLKPSYDTNEFQEMLKAAADERYEVVHDALARIREESAKLTTDNLSLDIYLILKFNSEDVTEDDINRYIEKNLRALEANPGYADLQNSLGILYAAKCKLFIDKANESFQSALRINRDFRKAEKNLKLAENDRQGIHLLLRALLD